MLQQRDAEESSVSHHKRSRKKSFSGRREKGLLTRCYPKIFERLTRNRTTGMDGWENRSRSWLLGPAVTSRIFQKLCFCLKTARAVELRRIAGLPHGSAALLTSSDVEAGTACRRRNTQVRGYHHRIAQLINVEE